MTSRMPKFLDRRKICIICEGAEEYEYLERLNTLNVWNEQYKVILDNADGNGNIPARYQDRYQNSSYDLVLVFCDTEKKPYEQYVDIKRKINEFHGVDNVADSVIIYGNPCTMQIILQHWCEEKLKTPSKKVNSSFFNNKKSKSSRVVTLYFANSSDLFKITPSETIVIFSLSQ